MKLDGYVNIVISEGNVVVSKLIVKNCRHCGKQFTCKYPYNSREYCSQLCYEVSRAEYMRQYMKEYHKKRLVNGSFTCMSLNKIKVNGQERIKAAVILEKFKGG